MSSISAWVLTISGITILGVLVDLILPLGATKKYIKGVFAFVVVLIIISPLPKLLSKEFSLNDIFEENAVVIQEDFIYQINKERVAKIEDMIESDIKQKGLENVEVKLNVNIFANDMEIDAVFVNLYNLVIIENSQHINTYETITESVLKYVSVSKKDIIFNE